MIRKHALEVGVLAVLAITAVLIAAQVRSEPAPAVASSVAPYRYEARVVRVIDGDTVVLDLRHPVRLPSNAIRQDRQYIGRGVWLEKRANSVDIVSKEITCRLLGIDTPEIRGPERPRGLEATEFLKSVLEASRGRLTAVTDGDSRGNFGRLLVDLRDAQGASINRQMLDAGQAVEPEY